MSRYLQKSKFHRTFAITSSSVYLGEEEGYPLDGESTVRLVLSSGIDHTEITVQAKLSDSDIWYNVGSLNAGESTAVIDISYWDMLRFRLERTAGAPKSVTVSGFYSDRPTQVTANKEQIVQSLADPESMILDTNQEYILRAMLKQMNLTNRLLSYMADIHFDSETLDTDLE